MFTQLGTLGGILERKDKMALKQDSGNPWAGAIHDSSTKAMEDYMKRGHTAGSQEFLDDPVLGKLFNQGQGYMGDIEKDLGNIRGEERKLASRGYSLLPEDYEAYGEASGNIAREFGGAENSLAQALASRGLSTSGSATRAFMGSQGNKLEQLAQTQRKIADDRMKTNMARLGQTRNFMSNLMGQQQGALGQQQGFARGGISDKNMLAQSKADMAQQNLSNLAGQSNTNLAQQRAVAPGSFMSAAVGGMQKGMAADINSLSSILSASKGGTGTQVQAPNQKEKV